MSALPILPWERTCAECDEARLVDIRLELTEDETALQEVPIFLEDTGKAEDLKRAKEISLSHYEKKVIKLTPSETEAIAYNAMIADLKT